MKDIPELNEVLELDRNEVEVLENQTSWCCDAPITESHFCTACGENQ